MSPRTSFHHTQARPNRRYRRLLPTAVAVASLAALSAPPAHAAGNAPPPPPPPAHAAAKPSREAILPRTEARATTERGPVAAT
jgi:hypothetical protein